MKKLLLFLSILTLLLKAENFCTQEQIAKMIKQNIDQSVIDKVCSDKPSALGDANLTSAQNAEIEHFFWRVGLGTMSLKERDFHKGAFNFGLHYYFNGLVEDGFGVGISGSSATKRGDTYAENLTFSSSETELLYNIHLKNGLNITPALIVANLTESTPDTKISDINATSVGGFGLYLTFEGVVRSGQGISLFIKSLNNQDRTQTLTLMGVQWIW